VHIDVRHLSPSPVGSLVRARAEVQSVEGRRVIFLVSARDEYELIGEGTHRRFIIDEERFLKRVEAKS
jgi:fluoroacetyl-CoA thioesterase